MIRNIYVKLFDGTTKYHKIHHTWRDLDISAFLWEKYGSSNVLEWGE